MSVFRWLRKKLKPPGPRELGLSERDALGCRSFTPFQKGPTWEDWDAIVKRDYPVRYFLSEVILAWLSTKAHFLRMWYYKWESLLLKHEYKIDLRDADPLHKYEHGYICPSEIVERACWKALMLHVEKGIEDPRAREFTEEDRKEQWFLDDVARYEEFHALYTYWTVTRKEDADATEAIRVQMHEAERARDEPRYRELQTQFLDSFRSEDEKRHEMLMRVVKLQPFMW